MSNVELLFLQLLMAALICLLVRCILGVVILRMFLSMILFCLSVLCFVVLVNCLLNASAFSLLVTFSLLLNVMLLLNCICDFLLDSFDIVCQSLRDFFVNSGNVFFPFLCYIMDLSSSLLS